jgi:hypothetical protein
MATVSSISDAAHDATPSAALDTSASTLLISLCPLGADALPKLLANLALAFPTQPILVATPDPAPTPAPAETLRVISYTPAVVSPGGWVLTAADYLNTYKLLQEHKSAACLLLGAEAQSLSPDALRALADGVATGGADLVAPRYTVGPRDGLVNSAILYPVTRALYGTRLRFPLAIDLGFSPRMAERLAACAQKFITTGQNSALVWPIAEGASAGFTLAEVPVGVRTLPHPELPDLNSILAQVAGSLFADIDAKASFWQRARLAYSPKTAARTESAANQSARLIENQTPPGEAPDIQPMLDSFRLAYTNLHEIWSLVLPPNSLLGLKKLSLMPPASFRMPDNLWARIVYDFILAYRLRTINRGHLLGALTPLYLAWVASHLLLTSGAGTETMAPEKHFEALAAAFETDKPYLVSRWRWPDRFNP